MRFFHKVKWYNLHPFSSSPFYVEGRNITQATVAVCRCAISVIFVPQLIPFAFKMQFSYTIVLLLCEKILNLFY